MQTKRRKFLIFSSLFGLSSYIRAREISSFEKAFQDVRLTIASVQEHMFPQGSKLPPAASINVTQFLFETICHTSFDRDIRAFVLEGAQELKKKEKGRFVFMTEKEKENALREYEKTNYGSSWLSRIMTLTMEGMFSDPIYGSNIKESAWNTVQSFGGFPRPKTKYMES